MKKPNRLPIQQFLQRIQQLNGYLYLLPCLYCSDLRTKLTKVVKLFDDMDLASHILRMVPRHWQGQYKLMGAMVLQSLWKLLEALECTKKAFPSKKECKGTRGSAKGGGSSKKNMVTFSSATASQGNITWMQSTESSQQQYDAHQHYYV